MWLINEVSKIIHDIGKIYPKILVRINVFSGGFPPGDVKAAEVFSYCSRKTKDLRGAALGVMEEETCMWKQM